MELLNKIKNILGSGTGKRIKAEIDHKLDERCIHRHSRETHPNCFRNGLTKKLLNAQRWYEEEELEIGFFDIETSDFQANAGFMLSWAIKFKDGDIVYDVVTKDDIDSGDFDKRICISLLAVLQHVDILSTYYGTGFDIKYIRSRCMKHGLVFPAYGSIYHFDLYYRVKSLLKINRNSLDAATRFFGIEGKNHVHIDDWFKASYGDKKALEYVLDHNIRDVEILEELFYVLEDYSKWTRKSI